MTAINQVDDVTPASECATGLPASRNGIDLAAEETAEDDHAVLRITNLPRDVAWMMVSVGVLGVILPGIPGAPFLIAGIAMLAPGGPRLLTSWARRRPKGVVHTGVKQIDRWLNDLERRYPWLPSTSVMTRRPLSEAQEQVHDIVAEADAERDVDPTGPEVAPKNKSSS